MSLDLEQQTKEEEEVGSPTEAVIATPGFLSTLQPTAAALTDPILNSSRLILLASSSSSKTAFSIAKQGTSVGFEIARRLLDPLALVADSVLGFGAEGLVRETTRGLLNGSEALALFGIGIGATLTDLTLSTLSSSAASLHSTFGNDEALRALGVFTKLVQSEYSTSLPSDPYPTGGLSRFSSAAVLKAMSTWIVLQNTTGLIYGQRIAGELQEIPTWGTRRDEETEEDLLFEVTEEQLLETGEEIIEASVTGASSSSSGQRSEEEIVKDHFRRFSKLCLGSYGGMGMLFFGVKLPSPSNESSTPVTNESLAKLGRQLDEDSLAHAFNSNHTAAQGEVIDDEEMELKEELSELAAGESVATSAKVEYGFWDILRGKHDTTVLEQLGGLDPSSAKVGRHPNQDSDSEDETAVDPQAKLRKKEYTRKQKKGRRPPRFFVVADHSQKAVLLILRGTISIDDVATDLACEPMAFDETQYWDQTESDEAVQGGNGFIVHSGMFEIARAMGGDPLAPVVRAIAKVMLKNPEYDLYLIGHSLGAGVAGLLALMWGNPDTSLTSSQSGLPVGRKIKSYGFAPPCTTDARLSRRARKLIHSFVYSSDAVSRFSLGSIRDIRSAAAWLCYANVENPEESCNKILSRLISFRRGAFHQDPIGKENEMAWFNSLRKTLEANMINADLFPPGDVFWLTLADDLDLQDEDSTVENDGTPRLFRVTGDVAVVFSQMLFTKRMLSSHLPHEYMKAIQDFF